MPRLTRCLAALFVASVAGAQVPVNPAAILLGDRAPKPAGARTIVGIVIDTLANPVNGAEVAIASARRSVVTDAGGVFRFDDIDPGTYDLNVRHPAHQPQSHAVVVDSGGAVTTFMLVPLARALAPVVVLGDRAPKPAGARTLTGIVVDTAANPIDSVDVLIASLRPTQRRSSNVDGNFRFDDIKPGTYTVSARRLGYLPQTRTVRVGNDGGVTTFALVPIMRALAPVITMSPRGGLSGVVADTAFAIVPGAEVSIIASDKRAITDSTGSFFIDARPGKYMVRIKRAGFTSRLLSVTVPKDSGRRIMAWLAPVGRASPALEEYRMYQLRERLALRSAATSAFWTRDEIMNMPMKELSQLVVAGAARPVEDGCMAFLDGGPQRVPLWLVRSEDIESLEVYPPGSLVLGGGSRIRSARPTSIRNQGTRPPSYVPSNGSPDDPCRGVQVYVWLRK